MKLVDTKDLKSLPLWECQFESGRGHQEIFNMFYFAVSNNKKAKILKKKIFRNYKNTSLKKAKAIIVCGGDGFMLHSIKKYLKYKKPFYGINCGNVGFLMNNYISSKFEKKVFAARKIYLNLMKTKIITQDNQKKILTAINETSLLRQTKQTSSIQIRINKKILLRELTGDGVVVSTPVGSTAYNYSIGGPILGLNSKKIVITPISPFRPRKWKGKIVSEKSEIIIENLKSQRPISVVADNSEVRNVKKVSIKINKDIKICVLYDKDNSFKKKIKLLNKA